MSQFNYPAIIRQLQKQIVALEVRSRGIVENTEVIRLQMFDGTLSQVLGFVIAYKLYIWMKMKGLAVEEQIQWVLSYM